jgi:hypothetical protein
MLSSTTAAQQTTATSSKFLRADGQRFLDPTGREVILHAINFGWIGCPELVQCIWWQGHAEEYRKMRDWGFNAVRMPVYWAGIERSPGEYNEAFLDEISQRVQWARDAGLYVIIDMHQDLWGNGVPQARGAPEWALLEPNLPHYSSGTVWSMAYFQSPRVQKAFDNFWADASGPGEPPLGIQERFARTWQHVAARFKDDPTVIGYDLFNEPFPGTRIEEVMQPMTMRMLPRLVLKEGPRILKQEAFDIALAGMELAQSNMRLYKAWTDSGARDCEAGPRAARTHVRPGRAGDPPGGRRSPDLHESHDHRELWRADRPPRGARCEWPARPALQLRTARVR